MEVHVLGCSSWCWMFLLDPLSSKLPWRFRTWHSVCRWRRECGYQISSSTLARWFRHTLLLHSLVGSRWLFLSTWCFWTDNFHQEGRWYSLGNCIFARFLGILLWGLFGCVLRRLTWCSSCNCSWLLDCSYWKSSWICGFLRNAYRPGSEIPLPHLLRHFC